MELLTRLPWLHDLNKEDYIKHLQQQKQVFEKNIREYKEKIKENTDEIARIDFTIKNLND